MVDSTPKIVDERRQYIALMRAAFGTDTSEDTDSNERLLKLLELLLRDSSDPNTELADWLRDAYPN